MCKMPSLLKIIVSDLGPAISYARDFATGAFHGLYTPFLLTTGLPRVKNNVNELADLIRGHEYDNTSRSILERANLVERNRSDLNVWTELFGRIAGVASQVPLLLYVGSQDYGKEYLATLAATNVIDYLYHAIQRSKPRE